MTEDIAHRPTPEFRDHLEWEVTRAVRRDSQLAQRQYVRRVQWTRAAVIALVSVAIGASAGLASAQIRDGSRRDSLLMGARAEADLANLRLQLARERMADATRRVQAGAVTAISMSDAQTELRAMEARAMRARYNIEEVMASALAPRDDLNAPLVASRDFVRDRLRLEAMVAQEHLTAAEALLDDAQRRVRVGAASDVARLDAEAQVAAAQAELGVVGKRLELRKEFVDRGTPVDQLMRRLDDYQLRADADVAQRTLGVARDRLSTLERQHRVGAIGDLDVMKAQVDVKERELDLQRLALRLREITRARRDSVP